jgi:hypothetical protein
MSLSENGEYPSNKNFSRDYDHSSIPFFRTMSFTAVYEGNKKQWACNSARTDTFSKDLVMNQT